MGLVLRCEKLECWHLAMQLADLVDAMTCVGPAAQDADFCRHIRRAATRAPAQIAEASARVRPADSATFLRMARASLGEVRTSLERGKRCEYWAADVFQKASSLASRALASATALMHERLTAVARARRRGLAHRPRS